MPEFGDKKSWEHLIREHKLRNTSEVPDVLDDENSPLAHLAYEQQEKNVLGQEDVVPEHFNPLDAMITHKRRPLEIDIEGKRFYLLKRTLHMPEGERSGTLTVTIDAQLEAEEAYYLYEVALDKYKKIFRNNGVRPVLENMTQEEGEKPGQYNMIFEFSTEEIN